MVDETNQLHSKIDKLQDDKAKFKAQNERLTDVANKVMVLEDNVRAIPAMLKEIQQAMFENMREFLEKKDELLATIDKL